MARSLNRLSAKKVEKLAKPGRHADGGGLYLAVSGNGSRRRWVFLYRDKTAGRLREMGLGSAREVSLADARELAARARVALRDGRDPLADRKAAQAIPTFGAMADEVVSSLENGWRNPKHRKQWRSTLTGALQGHQRHSRECHHNGAHPHHLEAAVGAGAGDSVAAPRASRGRLGRG
jgi:hypothetical protein